jgi:hypothetical protein
VLKPAPVDNDRGPILRRKLTHVPEAPTNPRAERQRSPAFDVAELYRGPIATGAEPVEEVALDEKLRQAYFVGGPGRARRRARC